MARAPRFDAPDSWHHVMNRAIARRTLFETEDDIRFFLSRVARCVHRGQLEVHAFCVMTTHFHLLLRSPVCELSRALQTIQNEYVRRFNRRRQRDGPLVRGRFRSRPVRSERYRRALVGYIDHNPVEARLVEAPALYPHGSARHFVRPSGPPWLDRVWVEACVRAQMGEEVVPHRGYLDTFGLAPSPGLRRLIERRCGAGPRDEDPLDELYCAAGPGLRDWMRSRCRLADGTAPGLPLVDLDSVEEIMAQAAQGNGPWPVRVGRRERDGWTLARIGLWRDLCAGTFDEIGRREGRPMQWAWNVHREHRSSMLSEDAYAARVGELGKAALTWCWRSVP